MGEIPLRRRIGPAELRRRFNEGRYQQRAEAGELQRVLRRDSHPRLEGSTEPFCTRSQILAYLDQRGEKIAVVHQYLRVDGSIGGSGRPDPKMLLEAGILYYVLKPDESAAPMT